MRRVISAALATALTLVGAVALSVTGPTAATATTPNGQDRGNVIVNMFQWTWNSIATECTNVLGPAGYAYVQVSPPQEHIQGSQWWTSYQPVSYKIESKLGTRAEFAAMVQTCSNAGVGIIADAVINHMTGQTGGVGWAGTQFQLEQYPGPEGGYGPQDFNSCKSNISDYGDRWQVQNCRLVALQDLATGTDYVQREIAAYLDDLASLGVAGYRIDAAKHMPAADLEAIKSKTTVAKNLYWVHEVIGAQGEPIQPSEYLGSGDSHEFNYARGLKDKFDGNISELQNIGTGWGLLNSNNAGVFVDNHDTERNGETMNYKWGAKYKLANMFMLSYPYGSPAVYTGYTFTDHDAGAPQTGSGEVIDANCANSAWTCAHRWPEIKNMVGFYNTVAGTALNNWQTQGGNVVAYGRGDKGFVVLNNTGNSVTTEFQTSLPADTYCDVVAGDDCDKTWTVGANGKVTVTVPAYGGSALHVNAVSGGGDDGSGGDGGSGESSTTTVFYSTNKNWNAYNVHYRVGSGAWTAVPGETMSPACSGWVSRTITANDSTVTAAFNNGSGTWDNNSGSDYSLSGAAVQVKDGQVTAGNPCDSGGSTNTTTVFYSTNKNWNAYNVHYRVGSGAWTAVPGETMSPACSGWVSRTITANDSTVTAAFNNGSGTWDNNSGSDYSLSGAAVQVKDGQVTAGNPCS